MGRLPMNIQAIQERLRDHIRSKIANRDFTGQELSRQAGIPQGHFSNFLNSRRGLSLESMDRLLGALAIGVLDLVAINEIQEWFAQPTTRSRYDVVPRISASIVLMPRLPRNGVLGVHCVDKSLLRRWRSNDVAGRSMWNRFVLMDVDGGLVRAIVPTARAGATLLIDRHYTSLERYHRSRQNLYLWQLGEHLAVGRISLLDGYLVLQPCDERCEVLTAKPKRGENYFDDIVGRVCQIRAEP
jgi:transcriptional regulator with XRE-family HTH domain